MEGYPVGSHYLRSSRVACRFSFCSFSTFSCFRPHCCCFSLMGYVGWAGGHKEWREEGAGIRCGRRWGRRLCKWQVTPFIWTFWKRKENIAFHTAAASSDERTDRQMKCLHCVCVYVGVFAYVCCVCVCVGKQQRVVSVLHNFISQQSLLPRCCLRCLALFPVSDAVSFY